MLLEKEFTIVEIPNTVEGSDDIVIGLFDEKRNMVVSSDKGSDLPTIPEYVLDELKGKTSIKLFAYSTGVLAVNHANEIFIVRD